MKMIDMRELHDQLSKVHPAECHQLEVRNQYDEVLQVGCYFQSKAPPHGWYYFARYEIANGTPEEIGEIGGPFDNPWEAQALLHARCGYVPPEVN